MRDDFKAADIKLIAERSGYRCSNPNCQRVTIGPDGGDGKASVGVAAHIFAAAPKGPRYDETMSSEERSSIENCIWLCQSCSRMIDVDRPSHPSSKLQEWRDIAIMRSYLALRDFDVVPTRSFKRLEARMPALIAEMRDDLENNPYVRRFIARSKNWSYYGGSRPEFQYYHEDHEHLIGKLQICEKYGATIEIHINDVPRWEFTEDFVDYLESTSNLEK